MSYFEYTWLKIEKNFWISKNANPKIFMHINGNSYRKYNVFQTKNFFSFYKNFTCFV